ncbi:MAG: hypothetical protein IKB39_07875 [Bacteroidaceae bacterium]|nr:hypothetical protein [Bacteroidaceae bacterium]
MTDEELKEILGEMQGDVINPELCNIPVPDMNQAVRAGTPTVCGDIPRDECLLLSKSFLNLGITFSVDVTGNSMTDIGIMPGDKLQIKSGPCADDGDIVVAAIDGEFTLKAFFRDENGQCWLVPANEAYKPIRLTEDMDVRIVGKVVKVTKDAPRYSHASIMRVLKAAETPEDKPMDDPGPLICKAAPMVRNSRHWYAVYRALVDMGLCESEMYATFVDMVARAVPEHPSLPTVDAMRRMAVGSFCRPVNQWNINNAPVTGIRFEEYVKIAQAVSDKR